MNRAAKRRQKYGSGSDRISRLPDSLLHHILCFLSQKKAVQTSVLSKSWRHLGPTRPVIELRGTCEYNDLGHVRGVCENCFNLNKKAFISVVEKTFESYHEHNLFPHQLDLRMLGVDSQSISILEKWIPIFINPDNPAVTTFRLSFDIGPHVNLPLVVFKAEHLRELHLTWCRLKDDIILIDNLMLKNLQNLSLHRVRISDEALEKVISGCPLVKRIAIHDCSGVFTVNIGNKNRFLNRFEYSCYYAGRNESSITINNPTLESIRIDGGRPNWYPNINNTNNNFPHLKFLFLSYVTLSAQSFENFPRLQELSLLCCYGFEEINLSSRSITRLIIHVSVRTPVKKLAIDAPNILYFEFSSNSLPTTFSLTATSKEWKSQLILRNYFCQGEDILQSILKLFEMVKVLRQSQISLTFYELFHYKIKEQCDFNDHPVVVEHLCLRIKKLRPDFLAHLFNALFRIFRPRYTNVMCVNDNKEVTEFLWKTLIHEREKTEYGWEKHLEEVSLEASDEKGIVWHHVQWTCFPKWTKNQKIRFRMKWRD